MCRPEAVFIFVAGYRVKFTFIISFFYHQFHVPCPLLEAQLYTVLYLVLWLYTFVVWYLTL